MTDENSTNPPNPPTPPAQPTPPAESFAQPTPPTQPPGTPPPAASSPYSAAPAYGVAAPPKQALSLTSFILGVAALIFSWVPILGFLASLAAVILGFMGKNREPAAPKWMWLVGIITGFVGIFINIIVVIFFILGIVIAASGGNYITN